MTQANNSSTSRWLSIVCLAVATLVAAMLWLRSQSNVKEDLTKTVDSAPAESIQVADTDLAEAERFYAQGIVALRQSDYVAAEQALRQATELSAQHEAAHLALVELSESPVGSLNMARTELERMQQRFPGNKTTALRLVRTLRKLGQIEQARQLLSTADNAEIHPLWLLEKAELDFDQARYDDASTALAELGLSTSEQLQTVIDQAFIAMTEQRGSEGEPLFHRASLAALAMMYSGRTKTGQQVVEEYLDRIGRLRRMTDLNRRQSALGPSADVTAELAKLTRIAPKNKSESSVAQMTTGNADTALADEGQLARGRELYSDLCAHCHGPRGDGNGRAARHLFPLPRNFLEHRLHFVTSTDAIALDADIARTIRQGLHGTSMPAYQQLNAADIESLVKVVREFQRTGARTRANQRGLTAEAANEYVNRIVGVDAEPIIVPARPEPSNEVLDRGRALFVQAACAQCHRTHATDEPTSSKADSSTESQTHAEAADNHRLFDEAGEPTMAPDLVTHTFKGGHSFEAIYARLLVGIPGTPHPALSASDQQRAELSVYLESLVQGQSVQIPNHLRRRAIQLAQ